MAASAIEWTDATWNPVAGCTWASPGCDHCYAAQMTRRLEPMGQTDYAGLTTAKHFNGKIRTLAHKLDAPLRWKKPRMVFVNSMSDLFHKDVPDEFIDKVFAVMALAHEHTFQVLTKRPERMRDYLLEVQNDDKDMQRWQNASYEVVHNCAMVEDCDWPLPNVWLGVSVENQEQADKRIPLLLQTPAAVRFLSCEPLLGPLDSLWLHGALGQYEMPDCCGHRFVPTFYEPQAVCPSCRKQLTVTKTPPRIHWVIVGGESGHGARPMHPDWARSLRDQCQAAGVPFFFKQWGEWLPGGCTLNGPTWPHGAPPKADRYQTHSIDHGSDHVYRVGKKAAG